MDAEAEGGVAVLCAIDDNPVRVREHGGIAIGRREREQDHVPGLERAAGDLRLLDDLLFSIVTLWAHDLSKLRKLKPRTSAWYPKSGPDLQRCHRGRTPRNIGASDYFHVPAAPRYHRNSGPYLGSV